MTQVNRLVKQFFSAWNDHDVDAVLDLMHRGAAIYDAFWLESCVGKNIRQYLRDGFEDEPYFYELIGDVIRTESGVVYRYSAHESHPANDANFVYEGAVALTVRDGLILTMSDFYCSPHHVDLSEIGRLASKRHGLPRHADNGLSAYRRMRLRTRLKDFIQENREELQSTTTATEVATKIGCSPEQLLNVVDSLYATDFATSNAKPEDIRLGDLLRAS